MSFDEVGKSFTQHYYKLFSQDRPSLAGVYRPNSLMTWVGEQIQGVENIMNRFTNLGFRDAQFKTDDIDCQPSLSNGVIVVINGEVLLAGESHSLKFNDVFHLAPDAAGQWYVSNQMFRIVGGGGN